MIDIHCHCLPGIDDGPDTIEEAVQLCRLSGRDGVTTIVATPHQGLERWNNRDTTRLRVLLSELQLEVGTTPALHLGGEIRICSELLDSLEDPRLAGFAPLAGSRYLLLEFSRSAALQRPEELIHEIRISGWRPILAHPEFIRGLHEDLGLMRRLARMGAFFQVTAGSLAGAFGSRVRRRVIKLLNENLVHFLASDAHGVSWRPPGLSDARRLVASRWGEGRAEALTQDNPAAVLEDVDLMPRAQARNEIRQAVH